MGAGGLNGELKTYSSDIDSQLRCNIQRFSREIAASSNLTPSSNTNFTPSSASRSVSPSRQDNSEQNMTCEDCGTNFTIFKRKNNCSGCKKNFCNVCFNQGAENAHRLSGKHCLTCRALASPILYKEQLMQLKIRNLQAYLRSVEISTSQCKEKRDLVDLIIKNAKSRGTMSSASSSQHASNQTFHSQDSNQPQSAARVQIGVPIAPGPFGVTYQAGQGVGQGPHQHHPAQQQNNPGQRFGQSVTLPGVPQYTAPSTVPGEHVNAHSEARQQQNLPAHSYHNQNNKAKSTTIDDLKNVEQVDKLSVKELKQILTANFVDFTGCCEKQELLDRVKQLWKSKQIGKIKVENSENSGGGGEDENLCKICMDGAIDCVLLECGHMVTCTSCGKQLVDCPICRQNIVRIVHVFRS